MKTTPFLEYILYDVFDEDDVVTARAMMGGYTLYMAGKVFAIIEDGVLWLKGSKELEDWYISHGSKKFSYIKEGKEQGMNYFLVPEEIVESKESFQEWVDVALSVATLPKKRKT